MLRKVIPGLAFIAACSGTPVRTIPVENHASEIAAANKFAEDADRLTQVHEDPSLLSSRVAACLEHLHSLAAGLSSCDNTTSELRQSIAQMNTETEQSREQISSLRADLQSANGIKWEWTIRASIVSFIAGIASVFLARFGLNILKVAGKVP